jgi:hypothetical protein
MRARESDPRLLATPWDRSGLESIVDDALRNPLVERFAGKPIDDACAPIPFRRAV